MKKNKNMIEREEFEDFDYLTVYVKKKSVNTIIKYYKMFKWKLKKQESNLRFKNVENLTFFRPHKIDKKDELQILQVDIETEIANIEKDEKYKYLKSTAIGSTLGLLGIIFFILSLYIITSVANIAWIFFGTFIGFVGVLFFGLTSYVTLKIRKKERMKFIVNKRKSRKTIINICETAFNLTENNNGKAKNIDS